MNTIDPRLTTATRAALIETPVPSEITLHALHAQAIAYWQDAAYSDHPGEDYLLAIVTTAASHAATASGMVAVWNPGSEALLTPEQAEAFDPEAFVEVIQTAVSTAIQNA